MFKRFLHMLAIVTGVLACAGCSNIRLQTTSDLSAIHSAYTVQTDGGAAIARVITAAADCPVIDIDAQQHTMTLRAAPATIAARDATKKDSKPADFPLRSCEALLPSGTRSAHIGSIVLPLAPATPKRIVIFGDTGCRMKQADNEFQSCNDALAWPFAAVVKSAAAFKPDLVVHVGDYVYRESACPAGNAGCAGSPWGFGMDAWEADFFKPAAALLKTAPWVFVRGNHESCARAGQGWFRFLDNRPWSAGRSCDNPDNDDEADFSAPYSVTLNRETQFIVFDSSRTGIKAYRPTDVAYQKYLQQLQQVDQLAAERPHNMFITHHPVLAFAQNRTNGTSYPGNPGLQSVMTLQHPQRLYPANVDATLHGHVHLFEAVNFSTPHPTALVIGNSGTSSDPAFPPQFPGGLMPAPGAIVDHFVSTNSHGYATLELIDQDWQLTEFDVQGRANFTCALKDGKSRCVRVGQEQ